MTDDEPAQPMAWTAIVCTDRGQHERTRLANLLWMPGRTWRVTAPARANEDEYASWDVLYPEDAPEQWLYEFFCPRCRRNPRIKRANWLMLVEAINPNTWESDPGVLTADFDVSALPF